MRARLVSPLVASLVAIGSLGVAAPVGASRHGGDEQRYLAAVLADAPLALWPLDGPPGATTAADVSGHGDDATLAGCAVGGERGPLRGAPSTLLGAAIGCDATFAPTTAYAGSYTVEAWVEPQGGVDDHYRTIVSTRGGPGAYAPYEFGFDLKLTPTTYPGGQELFADVGDGTQWLANWGVPFHWSAGTWYLAAVTVTPSALTFYVDGQPIGTAAVGFGGTPVLFDANRPVVLGGNPRYDGIPDFEQENVDANVADVALYPAALPAARLLAHFQAASEHRRGHHHHHGGWHHGHGDPGHRHRGHHHGAARTQR